LLDGVLRLADTWGAPLLIEADGSRGLPLKAPADWEPPIPDFVDTVIVTAGMSGLGKHLMGEWVYRPEDFGKLAGLELEQPIGLQEAARVLLHAQGGLKNIPAQARRVALLNQADSLELREEAAKLAQLLLDGYQRVVVGALHGPGGDGPQAEIHAVYQKTAGIILAAGAGRRMGEPKQLLEWQGEALVRKQARAAQEAGLDPVILVVGAHAAEVQAVTDDLKLRVAINAAWSEGQSSSVKAGLTAVPVENGAAVFLLADQPFISAEIIRRLVTHHGQTLAAVVAPRVGGQRANPVLFDRRTFAGLAALQGDTGGRQVMGQWGVDFVDWPDERLLLDIDNLEDYQRALDLI
jgi:molybdenum cofactor cytidylyltransferase